jgi:hypothetical protein
MNIDDGGDPKVRRKSLKMEMSVKTASAKNELRPAIEFDKIGKFRRKAVL